MTSQMHALGILESLIDNTKQSDYCIDPKDINYSESN